MLLNFGASNFYCFKEGVDVSLELGSKCPEAISKGHHVSSLLCVKGANASGKTNVLKVLAFLKSFCSDSFNTKPEEDIAIDSFFYNDDPIEVYCSFSIDDIIYDYDLTLKRKEVISEVITRKLKRKTIIAERRGNEIVKCIADFNDLKKFKYRSNASIISTSHQYESESLKQIYKFFNSIITNIKWFGKTDFFLDYQNMSKYYHQNPEILKVAIETIKECDVGIINIEIKQSTNEEGEEVYYPIFYHGVEGDRNWLIYHSESLGTQTLFRTIPYYVYALMTGGILVMDEFDTDFHPHILSKIVGYFDNPTSNKHNAQMLFSTHNTDILEVMSKYRTVLVNKEEGESYAYRLDEIPGDLIRNDRPIAPVYNSGKIGGVPKI